MSVNSVRVMILDNTFPVSHATIVGFHIIFYLIPCNTCDAPGNASVKELNSCSTFVLILLLNGGRTK